MKKFLHKKWLSIPIMVVLVLAITAGGVMAAYTFLGFDTAIIVDEPLTVEMAWWDYNENVWTDWWIVTGDPGADELDMYMSPGETQKLAVRIYNTSLAPLTVKTEFSGQIGNFTFDGWPNGEVPASNGNNSVHEWQGNACTVTARGDTPVNPDGTPKTYTIKVKFTRE